MKFLIIKTEALGDVLRTTSILSGLKKRYPGSHITWLTAPNAIDLILHHPLINKILTVDIKNTKSVEQVFCTLNLTSWDQIFSFEENNYLGRIVNKLIRNKRNDPILYGVYCDYNDRLRYTTNSSKWFDMSLISKYSINKANQLKNENTQSYNEIFAKMIGIEKGKPELFIPETEIRKAHSFYNDNNLEAFQPIIGLNTSAGNRWKSKRLSEECTAGLAHKLRINLNNVLFLLLGGKSEENYNKRIKSLLKNDVDFVDSGVHRPLLEFAAIIQLLDLLIVSDTLALHIAIALDVPVVSFFSPTSANEIELYGNGEKVISHSNDYCSYRPNTDNSSITPERLVEASYNVLRYQPKDTMINLN
ncbi:MAG: hypothetical protein LWX08_13480 [Deltaproteobacteria bacterium]|jgi:heptosyltransferase-2|nr:hypothetical protein [Deltaproteobacteria bacterium]